MAFKIPRYHHHLLLLIVVLCLSILIFFFLQYDYCYNSNTISNIPQHHHRHQRLLPHHRSRSNLSMSRKVLESKFDFTPFVHSHKTRASHDHHHHHKQRRLPPTRLIHFMVPKSGVFPPVLTHCTIDESGRSMKLKQQERWYEY